ncbi:TPA: nucleoside hydrolase [Candidatus Bathyarchaeota archaeon]|nr:nucleoside hydrolase [Candidatus Bathyarchaeota archaeon]
MRRVIIDTDIASGIGGDIDDALALLLALRSDGMEVGGITIVYGDVDVKARLALNILSVLGRRDVPVVKGSRRPLLLRMRRGAQEGYGRAKEVELLDPTMRALGAHAVDFILSRVKEHGDDTVVTLGPLTNIALALLKDPELGDHITRLVMMGGVLNAVSPDGFPLPTVEYNVAADPHAAKVVLNSGIPITMVPLDVTLRTLLSDERLERIASARSAVARYVIGLTGLRGRYPLHDPLAVGVAVDGGFVRTARLRVDVEVKGELTMGKTVVVDRGVANVDACIDVDAERFLDFFIETVMGRP